MKSSVGVKSRCAATSEGDAHRTGRNAGNRIENCMSFHPRYTCPSNKRILNPNLTCIASLRNLPSIPRAVAVDREGPRRPWRSAGGLRQDAARRGGQMRAGEKRTGTTIRNTLQSPPPWRIQNIISNWKVDVRKSKSRQIRINE